MDAGSCLATLSLDRPLRSPTGGDVHAPDFCRHVERGFDIAEARHTVWRLVARLPAREQRILWLRFIEERTQHDIGAQVGVTQVQVSRLITQSLAALRACATADPARPLRQAASEGP